MDAARALADWDTRTEQERIDDWREHALIEAGYPPAEAIELSRRADIDLHQAVELLARGCSVHTAMEILL